MIICELARKLVELAIKNDIMICAAESCTGGMVSQAITSIPGSSRVFYGSVVTYSNDAKMQLLGVEKKILKKHGAVSLEVAKAMVIGAMEIIIGQDASKSSVSKKATHEDGGYNIKNDSSYFLSIATTGIAGPSGGSEEKPVGLLYNAMLLYDKSTKESVSNGFIAFKNIFYGDREAIRQQGVIHTISRSIDLLMTLSEDIPKKA